MKYFRIICLLFFCLLILSACNKFEKQLVNNDNLIQENNFLEEDNTNIKEVKDLTDSNSPFEVQVELNKEQEQKSDYSLTENIELEKEIVLKNYDLIDMELLKLENKEKNMVYSPLSIKYALGMLREGASDEMKEKINSVIGEKFESNNRINSENYSLANGLFIRSSNKDLVKSEFINKTKSKYQADVVFDDFKNANIINEWIKNKTFGILNKAMEDHEIGDLDVALINTIAIDMDWEIRFWPSGEMSNMNKMNFNKAKNMEKEVLGLFERYDIHKVKLPEGFSGEAYTPYPNIYMTDEYYKETGEIFSYKDENRGTGMYQNNEINVISKKLKEYDGKQLEFIAIMPKQETLKEYIYKFSEEDFNKILMNLDIDSTKDGYETFINTEFPKFQFEYDCNLKENLITLGLEDIFNNSNNKFEKIMDSFYISVAKQKTQIDVNEEGIKVASSTICGGAGAGGVIVPSVYVDIIINRPFLFFIIDKDTKDVMFAGTVYDPTDYETASKSIEYW